MQKKRRAISRKACDNCRKAHSCCSETRPCKRCVGLELECIDTPSRKRGRKRKYNTDANENDEPLAKQQRISFEQAIPVALPVFAIQQQQQQPIKPRPATMTTFYPSSSNQQQLLHPCNNALPAVAVTAHYNATPPMIIPKSSLPPIPPQQPQQQPTSQLNNNALSMLQSKYSELDAKRDILHFMMIEESNPSSNDSYIYRNLMNEESFETFWNTLDRFIANKHQDSPEQAQKYEQVRKLFEIGHKGPTGLCFMHTECAKHFLLERVRDYVKRKMMNGTLVTTHVQQQQQVALGDGATNVESLAYALLDVSPNNNSNNQQQQASLLQDATAATMLPPPLSKEEVYILQILDFCQMGVFIYLVENGRVVLANKTAREVIGLDDETLNMKPMSWLDMYDGAYLPSTWLQMHQCFTFRPSPSSNTCVAEAVNLQCRNLKTGVMYSMNTHTTIFVTHMYSVCRFKVTKSESKK